MGKTGSWFCLSCKRQLKRPAFLCLLILFPIVIFFISHVEKQEQTHISVAMYGAEDPLSSKVMERLKQREGVFRFFQYDSEEAVEQAVASRSAECGFVFADNLKALFDEKRYKRSVRLYLAPSTVTDYLAAEAVSATILEVYSRYIYQNYMTSSPLFKHGEQEDQQRRIMELYENRMKDGSTFSFAYVNTEGNSLNNQDAVTVFPARGLIAVYIFVAGLFAAVSLGTDEKRGLLNPLSPHDRVSCGMASLLAPVVLAGASGIAAAAVSGLWTCGIRELTVAAAYVAAVGMFSYILYLILRSPSVLCCTIPFWIMGSLTLCPVFINIEQWIPKLSAAGKLFLPYYYMAAFR